MNDHTLLETLIFAQRQWSAAAAQPLPARCLSHLDADQRSELSLFAESFSDGGQQRIDEDVATGAVQELLAVGNEVEVALGFSGHSSIRIQGYV